MDGYLETVGVMDKKTLIDNLERIVGPEHVFHSATDLLVYEYDGSVDAAVDTAKPAAVVIPDRAEQVAAIVGIAKANDLPVVPRGAGTGLSGGSVAQQGGLSSPPLAWTACWTWTTLIGLRSWNPDS